MDSSTKATEYVAVKPISIGERRFNKGECVGSITSAIPHDRLAMGIQHGHFIPAETFEAEFAPKPEAAGGTSAPRITFPAAPDLSTRDQK